MNARRLRRIAGRLGLGLGVAVLVFWSLAPI